MLSLSPRLARVHFLKEGEFPACGLELARRGVSCKGQIGGLVQGAIEDRDRSGCCLSPEGEFSRFLGLGELIPYP